MNIRGCLSLRPRAVLEADPDGEHFNCFNWHFSGYDRKKHDAGCCSTTSRCNLGEISDYYRRFIEPPDIVVIRTRPMDAHGYFNFGADATSGTARSLERAKVVIVEVEPGAAVRARHRQRRARRARSTTSSTATATSFPELPNAAADGCRPRGGRA